jgi:hypothetical protein
MESGCKGQGGLTFTFKPKNHDWMNGTNAWAQRRDEIVSEDDES